MEIEARKLLDFAVQYAKFGGIGIMATAVHVSIFTALIEFLELAPLLANILAFGVAVLVSFFGHFNWTFKAEARQRVSSARQQQVAFARFVVVALFGLGLNSLLVFLVVNVAGLPYRCVILPMVFVVPPILFLINKFWSFRLA